MRPLMPLVLSLGLLTTTACEPATDPEPDDVGSRVDLGRDSGGGPADTGQRDAAAPDASTPTPDASTEDASTRDAAPDTNGSDDASHDASPDASADASADASDASNDDTGPDTPTVTDDFAGDGPLLGYVTNNPEALPEVARVAGRYHANLTDNTGNVTLHFNQDQGRLDAKRVTFPFDYVARNIGIGTQADAQTAPAPQGSPFVFAGVQVHVLDLESRNSSHVVVGHRGSTHYTVEGKNTVDGNSSVNDVGANTAPDGRADIRIVGNPDRTLTVYWQVPNLDPTNTPDQWTLYRGDGTLPGPAPAYGDEVYVGLITYAYQSNGLPFVGTCDEVELVGE